MESGDGVNTGEVQGQERVAVESLQVYLLHIEFR